MPYIVTLVPVSPYAPWVEAIGYTPGTFSKPFKWEGEWIASVLSSGLPIDPDIVPRRYKVDVNSGLLPEIFGLSFGYCVTERFREKVEDLEPDVHQFFSIEVFSMDDSILKKGLWLLNVCNRVDAIVSEKTRLPLGPGGRRYCASGYIVGNPIEMVLRKDVISEKCMWIDRRCIHYFFSDALFEFIEGLGFEGFYATRVAAE